MRPRKDQLTTARIDREYPHQVELPAQLCRDDNEAQMQEFCSHLRTAPRGRWFRKEGAWFVRRCFASPEDAEAFQRQFGGERVDVALKRRSVRLEQQTH